MPSFHKKKQQKTLTFQFPMIFQTTKTFLKTMTLWNPFQVQDNQQYQTQYQTSKMYTSKKNSILVIFSKDKLK